MADAAVLEYTAQFDRLELQSMSDAIISTDELQAAKKRISPDQLAALEAAAERVRLYAGKQALQSWQFTEEDGTMLGQQIMPLDRVGLYVPGGKAAYPSSVLMNVIPASVAGVREITMVVPYSRW